MTHAYGTLQRALVREKPLQPRRRLINSYRRIIAEALAATAELSPRDRAIALNIVLAHLVKNDREVLRK